MREDGSIRIDLPATEMPTGRDVLCLGFGTACLLPVAKQRQSLNDQVRRTGVTSKVSGKAGQALAERRISAARTAACRHHDGAHGRTG